MRGAKLKRFSLESIIQGHGPDFLFAWWCDESSRLALKRLCRQPTDLYHEIPLCAATLIVFLRDEDVSIPSFLAPRGKPLSAGKSEKSESDSFSYLSRLTNRYSIVVSEFGFGKDIRKLSLLSTYLDLDCPPSSF